MSQSSSVDVKRALVIVNPRARRAERAGVEALHAFEAEKVACDVVFTEAPGHATVLAKERSSKVDAVFTIGGDGTAMEVVTALVKDGPPVGILPGGTGNVIVHSLGIPGSVRGAVHALLRGKIMRIDLGRLDDGRHFAIGLGCGLDEAMIAGASHRLKKRFGAAAYVWAATKAVSRMQRFRVKLTVDGVVHEREATSVLIANLGAVLGGAIRLGHGIAPDDGLLNACIFSPRNFADAVGIFTGMLRGTAHLHPSTFYVAGRHFRLEVDPPRRAQADGELLDMTPLEVVVEPLAARLIIPRRDPRSS